MDNYPYINRKVLRERAEKALESGPIPNDNYENLDSERLLFEIHLLQIQLDLLETEFKILSSKYLESEEKYFEFYNMSPVGFVTVNIEGSVKEINLALVALINIKKSELILQNFSHLIKMEDREKFFNYISSLYQTQITEYCEVDLITSEDTYVTCRIKGKQSQKNPNFIRMVVHDITDHVSNEKRLSNLLKQLSIANETINSQNYELRELNTKLEMSKIKLNNSIKEKDEFLNSIYRDLTLVFSRFLVLSECIIADDKCSDNPDIINFSQDLYSSVKETLKLIDCYFKL